MYDANYRREAAATGHTDWSKIDPSLYARCFTGWARNTGWCDICMTLDHDAADCPYNQGGDANSTGTKQPQRMQGGQLTPFRKSNSQAGNQADAICFKYNKYGGDCMFGSRCHFKHICSVCAKKGLHMDTQSPGVPKGCRRAHCWRAWPQYLYHKVVGACIRVWLNRTVSYLFEPSQTVPS